VSRAQYGVAGGFLSMVRNSGQVIGVAMAGAVLINAIAPVVGVLGLNALQNPAAGVDHTPLVNAFLSGMRHAYTISAVLAAIGAIFSLSRGRRTRKEQPSQEQETVVLPAAD
jgi:hypothetical protein